MLNLKLEVPRQHARLVERLRLIETLGLAEDRRVRLCLIVASAGYGKTTLLAQWAEHLAAHRHRMAWLTVDEADADPRLFLSYVIFALRKAGIDLPHLVPHAEQGLVDTTPEACLTLLAEALAQPAEPVALILDDYHRAANPALDALLLKMIRVVPPRLLLVVSARTRPDIGVPQLVVAGLAQEVEAQALRLTAAEARELFDGDVSEPGLRDIVARTEGWPVALQMTRLAARNGIAPTVPAGGAAGQGGYLSSYLADRVMGTLTDDLIDFLLETSTVERFNIPLANAIRERDDSAALFEALEPLQSLLTPLSAEDGWFRYHHLFQDHLRVVLMRRRPEAVPVLHLRASAWFERHGHVLEAVRHARSAGAYATCARLIEEAGGWRLVLYGGINHLRTLVGLIPEPERLKYPRMLIAEAYLKLKEGKVSAARHLLALAGPEGDGRLPPADRDSSTGWDGISIRMMLEAYQDNALTLTLGEAGNAIRASLPEGDALAHGVVLCVQILAWLRIGQIERAAADAQQAMHHMRAAHTVLGMTYCLLHIGTIALYRGDLDLAADHLARAQALALENFGADAGLKQVADILQEAVTLWREGGAGDGTGAAQHFLRAADEQDGWLDVYAANIDVRFQAGRDAGDGAAMEQVLDDARHVLQVRGIDRLMPIIQARQLDRALDLGDEAEAERVGTPLLALFSPRFWEQSAALWRPLQDAGQAVLRWLQNRDPQRALVLAQDLVACSDAVGSGLYRVQWRVAEAAVLAALDRPDEARTALSAALAAAAAAGIRRPFMSDPRLRPLLQTMAGLPAVAANLQVGRFLDDLLVALDEKASSTPPDPARVVLSVREREVMHELALGLTNKEIARSLGMTDHTVKFHVRNIFAKLGVERRAHAIAIFRSQEGGRA